jgi:O-antigen ligase
MANQLAAILGWGVVMLLAPAPAPQRSTLRALSPLLIVLGIAATACLASILTGGMPSSPGYGVIGIMLLAAAVAVHGASAGASDASPYFRAFAIALLVNGLCNGIIAVVQIYAPGLFGNTLIALPTQLGRANGNFGQSNQLADALLWGLVAQVVLARAWWGGARGRFTGLARLAWVLSGLLMIWGVVLTGSRTGLVALVLMAAWGLADRRLARPIRIGLAASPVAAAALVWASGALARALGLVAVLTTREGADVTAFRSEIWSSALTLIKDQPWLGVGWGQFNFAWTLTPFPLRSAGLVDNAHNLPLQLAVELGVPLALLMVGLLVWLLWKALSAVWQVPGEAGAAARSTVMIVVVVGLHSMLEYPLWYSYLLLPTAWALGLALGTGTRFTARQAEPADTPGAPAAPLRAWRVLGLMMVVLSASAWLAFLNIVSLYLPSATSLPLEERIRQAQRSPLFSDQADYAAVVNLPPSPELAPALVRSAHVLLNGRLMYAWANLLYQRGEIDKARFMAARLREFNLSGPRPWYAPCDDPAVTAKPFQCLPPEHPVTWRDFR